MSPKVVLVYVLVFLEKVDHIPVTIATTKINKL